MPCLLPSSDANIHDNHEFLWPEVWLCYHLWWGFACEEPVRVEKFAIRKVDKIEQNILYVQMNFAFEERSQIWITEWIIFRWVIWKVEQKLLHNSSSHTLWSTKRLKSFFDELKHSKLTGFPSLLSANWKLQFGLLLIWNFSNKWSGDFTTQFSALIVW